MHFVLLNKCLQFLVLLPLCYYAAALFEQCNHRVNLQSGEKLFVNSPYYPREYPVGTSCRYTLLAPKDHQLKIKCNIQLNSPGSSSARCINEIFYFNNEGSELLSGSEYFCGSGTLERKSFLNRAVISYMSQPGYSRNSMSSVRNKFESEQTVRTKGTTTLKTRPYMAPVKPILPVTTVTTTTAVPTVPTTPKKAALQPQFLKPQAVKQPPTRYDEFNFSSSEFNPSSAQNLSLISTNTIRRPLTGLEYVLATFRWQGSTWKARGKAAEAQLDARVVAESDVKRVEEKIEDVGGTTEASIKTVVTVGSAAAGKAGAEVVSGDNGNVAARIVAPVASLCGDITCNIGEVQVALPSASVVGNVLPVNSTVSISGEATEDTRIVVPVLGAAAVVNNSYVSGVRIAIVNGLGNGVGTAVAPGAPAVLNSLAPVVATPSLQISDATVYNYMARPLSAYQAPNSGGGYFSCLVEAVEPPCDCGWSKVTKVAGHATEAGINEFPSMAGVLSMRTKKIFCGATIIHHRYLISAAHCFRSPETEHAQLIAVIVGEHDVSTVLESLYTRLYELDAIITHENFVSSANSARNDIALLRTRLDIEWNRSVGPACLPFRSTIIETRAQKPPFTGQRLVTAGWGTTSFGGAQSTRLLKTTLDVIAVDHCKRLLRTLAVGTFCTFTPGTDTCQYDSGGALYARDNRLFAVGIVSYGFACASNQPSVNTKVSAFIRWINSKTPEARYCVK